MRISCAQMEPSGTLDSHHSLSVAGGDPEEENDVESDVGIESEGSRKESWSRSGDFICLHNVQPRVRSYESYEMKMTFPVPLKYIDVMRQTKTDIVNVSENMINDVWTEDKKCQPL